MQDKKVKLKKLTIEVDPETLVLWNALETRKCLTDATVFDHLVRKEYNRYAALEHEHAVKCQREEILESCE